MMIRLAFFDMDGTLCAPRFYVNGTMVVGMSDEAWISFCRANGENTYRFCKPVPAVAEYAEELHAKGASLYVLSTVQTGEEAAAKQKFTKQNFPGLFSDVLTVQNDADKFAVMRQLMEEKGVRPEECELVEDTYATVLAAAVAGMRATHVSHLYCKRD